MKGYESVSFSCTGMDEPRHRLGGERGGGHEPVKQSRSQQPTDEGHIAGLELV